MTKTTSGLPKSLLKAQVVQPVDSWKAEGHRIWLAVNRSAWDLGDWWAYGEDQGYGERKTVAEAIGFQMQTCMNAGTVARSFETYRRREVLSFAHHAEVASLPEADQEVWLDKAEAGKWSREELRHELKGVPQGDTPALPAGTYSTLVVDPPWEMQKISREVRPNQKAMDYPAMSVDELITLEVPAATDAHLYLWTTHKHLPDALAIAEAWGFNYQCVLTWVKNVGITPFSWMYSTELALFCRRGNLDLLQLGRRVDFAATVREHSRKPDEFYDLVREVSPGPRLDMFAREEHEGFDVWGNETARFAADA